MGDDTALAGSRGSACVVGDISDEDDPERYIWPEDLDPGDGEGVPGDGDVPPEETDPDDGASMDLASRALAAGSDPARKSSAELIDSIADLQAVIAMAQARQYRQSEELMRRRKPRKWDRRAGWKEGRREQLNAPEAGFDPATRRTWIEGTDYQARPAVLATREVAEEIALALNCTKYAARAHVELVYDLSNRLPRTFTELDAGRATPDQARIAADYSQDLTDEDAGKLDALIAPQYGTLTTGELRSRVRRLMVSIDPDAAERRRARSERKSKVTLQGNSEGTATLAIERIPAAQGAAAKARVNALAHAYKRAGAEETIAQLEARTAVGLLLGSLPDIPRPGGPSNGSPGPWSGRPWSGKSVPWPRVPATAAMTAPGCARIPPGLVPGNPGHIKLTTPWRTLTGLGAEAADLTWLGPVTPGVARDLASAAAADPNAAWHLIVTDDDGHALASTPVRPRRSTGHPGMISDVTVTITEAMAACVAENDDLTRWIASVLARLEAIGHGGQPPGSGTGKLADLLAKAVALANRAADQAWDRECLDAAAAGCAHTMQTSGYRILGTLRRWLNVRDGTCRNPVCRQPAARCDQDHTHPYRKGGRSCPCNIGAECRTDHQLKQLPGWRLSQDAQACFTWRTPTGHVYRKEPHRYPV